MMAILVPGAQRPTLLPKQNPRQGNDFRGNRSILRQQETFREDRQTTDIEGGRSHGDIP